jgi:hypothetical protein
MQEEWLQISIEWNAFKRGLSRFCWKQNRWSVSLENAIVAIEQTIDTPTHKHTHNERERLTDRKQTHTTKSKK